MRPRSITALAMALPLAFALACGTGAPVVDVLPPGDTADTAGPYEVSALIAESDRVTEARVLWFVGDGPAPRPLPFSREDRSDRWTAHIPGQPAGTTVRFRVEVETDEGHLVRLPAPTEDDPSPAWTFFVGPGSDG